MNDNFPFELKTTNISLFGMGHDESGYNQGFQSSLKCVKVKMVPKSVLILLCWFSTPAFSMSVKSGLTCSILRDQDPVTYLREYTEKALGNWGIIDMYPRRSVNVLSCTCAKDENDEFRETLFDPLTEPSFDNSVAERWLAWREEDMEIFRIVWLHDCYRAQIELNGNRYAPNKMQELLKNKVLLVENIQTLNGGRFAFGEQVYDGPYASLIFRRVTFGRLSAGPGGLQLDNFNLAVFDTITFNPERSRGRMSISVNMNSSNADFRIVNSIFPSYQDMEKDRALRGFYFTIDVVNTGCNPQGEVTLRNNHFGVLLSGNILVYRAQKVVLENNVVDILDQNSFELLSKH